MTHDIDTAANEIQRQIDAIVAMLIDRGVERPRVDVDFRSGVPMAVVYIHAVDVNPEGPIPDMKAFRGDTLSENLADALAFANDMPTGAERDAAVFRRRLAELIELGREKGIDLEFLNPLSATMKRLSENAIEAQA